MALADIHDADMAAILTDAGNSFTFDGTSYACIVSDRVKRKDLAEGGFMPDYDLSISTRVSILPATLPEPGDTVTIDGQAYKVVRQRKNFTNKLLVLDLMTTDK